MKLYYREVTKKVSTNRFGKLSYKRFMEVVATEDITPFNKGKHIKFEEVQNNEFNLNLFINVDKAQPNKVYTEEL